MEPTHLLPADLAGPGPSVPVIDGARRLCARASPHSCSKARAAAAAHVLCVHHNEPRLRRPFRAPRQPQGKGPFKQPILLYMLLWSARDANIVLYVLLGSCAAARQAAERAPRRRSSDRWP